MTVEYHKLGRIFVKKEKILLQEVIENERGNIVIDLLQIQQLVLVGDNK